MARKVSKTVKKYNAGDMAFGKSSGGRIIPNTTLIAGKTSEEFYSLKNTIPVPSTGKITSQLSDKIARAVLTSQVVEEETLVGWGRHDKKEFYLGCFEGGSKNKTEYFIIIPEDNQIITTNANSHLFYKLIVSIDLLNFVNKGPSYTEEDYEVFHYLKKLKLPLETPSEDDLLLDNGDTKAFTILCDSILMTAKSFNGFEIKEIDMSNEDDENMVNDFMFDIKYNILPLLAMQNTTADLTLDLDGVVCKEITPPKIKRKRKSSKKKDDEDVTTPYPLRDYTLMSDEEADSLPDDLKRTRQIAIDLFERNKEFLTDEQWESIVSFKNGSITKLGMYGPSATGKTTFVKMLAGALKLPYAIVTGNNETEKSDLFGYMTVKDGSTMFCEGPMIQIMRHGGIFFFDERNMVNAGVVAATNNILDDTRMYSIPQTGETLIAHPLFRYCEAFNIGYEGTREDNLSHASRIDEWHKMSGYDEQTEANIITKESGLDNKIALKMVQIKNVITNKINEGVGDESIQRVDLRTCLSWARKTIDLSGDVVRAALTTVMAPLAREVDDIYQSSTEKDFLGSSDELIAFAIGEIKSGFQKPKPRLEKKEYDFQSYSL